MLQSARTALFVALMFLFVCLANSNPIWAQGKGGGKGGGGGGGGEDPPPPGMPEVRYHVELLQPPPGMVAVTVLDMAKESRELIAEAAEFDDPSISDLRLISTPHLRLSDGTWIRLFPPVEAGPVDPFAWRIRAISDSGRFVLFYHQLDPDRLRVECDFWVWDRFLNEYYQALYWPGQHQAVGYAINDHGEILFRGFIGTTLSTLFVSNSYLEGQPVDIGSGDLAFNDDASTRTINNRGQLAHRMIDDRGARFQILDVDGTFGFVFDRYLPPFWSGNQKNLPSASLASDINQFGDVTGASRVNKDYRQACLHYDDGELVNIHPPAAGKTASIGRAINDQKWVIGTAEVPGVWFLHVPGYTSAPLRDLLIAGDLQAYDATGATTLVTQSWRSQIANDGTILHQRWNPHLSRAVPFLLTPLD